jgi:hypothetical protein
MSDEGGGVSGFGVISAAKTGFEMGVPFNELNRVLDLGFKPLPWGDTGYLPSKYRPLGQGPK